MNAHDFDFVRFREVLAQRQERAEAFVAGKTNVLLSERRIDGDYTICRTPQESLAVQLDMIDRNLDLSHSGYVPYLEPWFGVGVFANAFGCEYVWVDGKSAQTHYLVHSVEEADQLTAPDLAAAPVMQLVREAICYFLEQTRGAIPISLTDTQSPFDTATLIWETSSFFTAMRTDPEVVHRVLNLVTETILAFSQEQAELLGETWARPGHIMQSTLGGKGISISDDNIVMVGPDDYRTFSVPYNERLAKAFGGVAVHSCGNFEKQLPALVETEGLIMIDGAFTLQGDPNPNEQYEYFRETMAGRGVILQARMGSFDWPERSARLYHPELPLVIVPPAPAADEPADKNHRRLEEALAAV